MKYKNSMVEALHKARVLIAGGTEDYICIALNSVGSVGAKIVRDDITNRIKAECHGTTLDSWLKENCPDFDDFVKKHNFPSNTYQRAMRMYRLRFIDHLIKEYSK